MISSSCHAKDKRACRFIGLCILCFSFVCKSEAKANYGVIIPFIRFNTLAPLLVIIFAFIIMILLSKAGRVKFDGIALLMLIRCILNLIPPLYINVPHSYLGNYVSAWVPFLFYFILLNLEINPQKTYRVFVFFGILISAQCFLAYYSIVSRGIASYFDPWYKSYFVIPIGGTNTIACILNPLLIIGNRRIQGKKRFIYDFLLTAAIILTKSRGGVCIAVLYYFLEVFLNSTNKKRKVILIIALLPLFAAGIAEFLSRGGLQILQTFFRGYSTGKGTLNSLLSGRLTLYKQFIIYIGNHLLFGNGVSYDQLAVGANGTHNIFLTILYENGLTGAVLYGGITAILLSRIRVYKEPGCIGTGFLQKTPAVVMLIIFLNSLFEPSLFLLPVDLIFTTMICLLKAD